MGDMWRRARLLLLASAVGIAPALTACGGDDSVKKDKSPANPSDQDASADEGTVPDVDSAVPDVDAGTDEATPNDGGTDNGNADEDVGQDSGTDAPVDSGTDAPDDNGTEGPADAGRDAGEDEPDTGTEPNPVDAGSDAGSDGPVCELPSPGTILPALRQKATIHLYTNCGTMPARELPPNLLDGNTATKFLCFAPTPTIGVAFQNLGSAVVKTYTLTSANDAPERDPRRWRFEGSNDGVTWDTLDERTNQVFGARFETRRYDIANCKAYSRYRLVVIENRGAENVFQLAELGLHGEDGGPLDYLEVDHENVTSTCPNEEKADENHDRTFDGDFGSKWFCGGNKTPEITATFKDGQPHVVTSYAITSGNDNPDRDPKSWVIEGSNDNGETWEALAPEQTEQTFLGRVETRFFTLDNETPYLQYRVRFTENNGSVDFQISEITFFGE